EVQHLLRPPDADEARETLGRPEPRNDAVLQLRHAEVGDLGGDPQVAHQRQLEAAADGDPVDRGDQRLRVGLDARVDALELLEERHPLLASQARHPGAEELLQIAPGAERVADPTGEADRRDGGIVRPGLERRHDLVQHLTVDGVDGRPHQGDGAHALLVCDRQVVKSHACSLRTTRHAELACRSSDGTRTVRTARARGRETSARGWISGSTSVVVMVGGIVPDSSATSAAAVCSAPDAPMHSPTIDLTAVTGTSGPRSPTSAVPSTKSASRLELADALTRSMDRGAIPARPSARLITLLSESAGRGPPVKSDP